MTDNLTERLQNGESEAFRQLVETYQERVLNTCYRFMGTREDAEDITQEVFLEVFQSINRFRGDAKLSTWIYRIAVTKSLDSIRRRKRKKRQGQSQQITGEEAEMVMANLPAGSDTNPEVMAERAERVRVLNLALDKLPRNQRAALTLSKIDQMSYQEIAEVLETTISAVESLIHRGRTNLRKRLQNYYDKLF